MAEVESRPTRWFEPEHPPWGECVDAGGGVWWMWDNPRKPGEKPLLMLWHWCDRNVIVRTDSEQNVKDRAEWWYEEQWVLVGTEGHERSGSTAVPTLHPSVLWPFCCNKHGYLDKGKWRDV